MDLRSLAVIGLVVLAAAGVYLARDVLVPFLLAAVIAYTLNPLVTALERRGVGRALGAALVMAGIAGALAGVLALMVPEIIGQVRSFADRLPGYRDALIDRLAPLEAYLQQRYPDQLQTVREQALGALRGFLPGLVGYVAEGAKEVATSLVGLILWLLTIVVIPVFAYYLLADYEGIRLSIAGALPARLRPALERRASEIDRVLRSWLKGQLTVAFTLAIIYAIGLSLLRVPLGLLIGVVGGLANLVPYMGLVVGFLPAALLSFLDSGSWVSPVLVAGVFLLGQVLEGTVISPRVVGAELGMPPALVLLSVLVGGELFGFTGLLLAVPSTAAGLVLLRGAGAGAAAASSRRPVRRRRPAA